MKTEITYSQAKERHPELVQEIIAKLRKGRSKHKNAAPEDLQWFYAWACLIEESYSGWSGLQALMAQKEEPKDSGPPLTVTEELTDQLTRVRCVLEGRIGRWWGGVGPKDNPERIWTGPSVPQEVQDIYRENIEDRRHQEAEIEKMAPEEREEQAQEALASLMGQSGFVALSLPIKKENTDGNAT